MTNFDYSRELDQYRHRNYRIGVRADPSFNDVEDFAVVLYFSRRNGDHVNVARIDNSDVHDGRIHLDRLYREDGAALKDYDIPVESWDEAVEYIEKHWKKYADIYDDNHGTDSRE